MPHKLQRFGCDFVTYHPLTMPEAEVNELTCQLVCRDRKQAGQRIGRPGRREITPELREKVKSMYRRCSLGDVGKIYGLPKSTVFDIVHC
ncbi:hypothetical protein KOR34_44770 [Posidoniimonas corsicana]|uniref:Uncharacterized protein n=2 Tax=Posidoniimonas corsicana TaxID=1938618 RepID=A0A5C5UZK8_9BACT|nr:hypothetical protein KOR34_44770 [Posidoniimonas corsicana]